VKDPVAAYHRLLDDGRLTGDSAEALTEGQRGRSLMFGERPLCVAIRPQILTRPRYEQAISAAQGVYSALATLEKAVLKNDDLRRELALEPEEERLAMADPGFRSSSSSVRLDSFFADEVRFVEYNAESPAGMAYSDNLAAVFAQLPVMKAFRKLFRGRFLPTRRRQLSAMLRAFRQWDRGATPVVAIVDSAHFALPSTPSTVPSACELTCPASAHGARVCALTGPANRTRPAITAPVRIDERIPRIGLVILNPPYFSSLSRATLAHSSNTLK